MSEIKINKIGNGSKFWVYSLQYQRNPQRKIIAKNVKGNVLKYINLKDKVG